MEIFTKKLREKPTMLLQKKNPKIWDTFQDLRRQCFVNKISTFSVKIPTINPYNATITVGCDRYVKRMEKRTPKRPSGGSSIQKSQKKITVLSNGFLRFLYGRPQGVSWGDADGMGGFARPKLGWVDHTF